MQDTPDKEEEMETLSANRGKVDSSSSSKLCNVCCLVYTFHYPLFFFNIFCTYHIIYSTLCILCYLLYISYIM